MSFPCIISPVSIVEIMRVYLLPESICTSQYEKPGIYLNTWEILNAYLTIMTLVKNLIIFYRTEFLIAWKHTFNHKESDSCVITGWFIRNKSRVYFALLNWQKTFRVDLENILRIFMELSRCRVASSSVILAHCDLSLFFVRMLRFNEVESRNTREDTNREIQIFFWFLVSRED